MPTGTWGVVGSWTYVPAILASAARIRAAAIGRDLSFMMGLLWLCGAIARRVLRLGETSIHQLVLELEADAVADGEKE
jgi:hypothetical protein